MHRLIGPVHQTPYMNRGFSLDIQQFREGDKKAFKTTFDCLFESICLFVNRFINNVPAAEDIAQETFISLWNHRAEMQSAAHIKSFLYISAHNASLDYLKHEKIKNAYTSHALQESATTETFIHFVIEEEVARILHTTEQELPTQCRQIFILAMQGISNEDIATQMGISINTVKTQKKIAYRRLKQHIAILSDIIILLFAKT